MKVTLDGNILADSEETIVVEGNHYFPPDSVKTDLLKDSTTHTICAWKGTASYYNAQIDENTVNDIAWYYPHTSEKAKNIENYVAFYKNKVKFE